MTLENEDGDDDEEIVHKVTQLHLTSWPDHGVSCTITNDHGVGYYILEEKYKSEDGRVGFTITNCK